MRGPRTRQPQMTQITQISTTKGPQMTQMTQISKPGGADDADASEMIG